MSEISVKFCARFNHFTIYDVTTHYGAKFIWHLNDPNAKLIPRAFLAPQGPLILTRFHSLPVYCLPFAWQRQLDQMNHNRSNFPDCIWQDEL